MKIALILLIAMTSFGKGFGAMIAMDALNDSTISVLVLPAYDEIANAGVSPDTRKILESTLANQRHLLVLPLPFKKLRGVAYQMVFDKKYCRKILEKVDCDIIIMTKIITENERKPGSWPWSYKIRIYNTKTGIQLNSIQGDNLKAEEFQDDINRKVHELVSDIGQTFKGE
jgi:hypothetical protein